MTTKLMEFPFQLQLQGALVGFSKFISIMPFSLVPIFNYLSDRDYSWDSFLLRKYWIVSVFLRYSSDLLVILFFWTSWISPTNLICAYLFKNGFIDLVFWINSKRNLNETEVVKYVCHHILGPGKHAALMYFVGYLNKILPVSEFKPHTMELAGRIRHYEEVQEIEIPLKKLLILIPLSGRTEPLIGGDSKMIEKRKDLENLVINRAGVAGRSYSNSVYKLFLDDEKETHTSVVAEYATPLATLTEIFKETPHMSKEIKACMIETFFHRLTELLKENPGCGKYCDLILYDDAVDDSVAVLRSHILFHLANH